MEDQRQLNVVPEYNVGSAIEQINAEQLDPNKAAQGYEDTAKLVRDLEANSLGDIQKNHESTIGAERSGQRALLAGGNDNYMRSRYSTPVVESLANSFMTTASQKRLNTAMSNELDRLKKEYEEAMRQAQARKAAAQARAAREAAARAAAAQQAGGATGGDGTFGEIKEEVVEGGDAQVVAGGIATAGSGRFSGYADKMTTLRASTHNGQSVDDIINKKFGTTLNVSEVDYMKNPDFYDHMLNDVVPQIVATNNIKPNAAQQQIKQTEEQLGLRR